MMEGTIHAKFSPARSAGLYVHVPFCLKKCDYCNFYSVSDLSLRPAYLGALEAEMRLVRQVPAIFDTLYIGGGTPSVLAAEDIRQIIANALRYFSIQSDVEMTLEANPGTVTPESLSVYRRSGINRLNIGVQSFQNHNLRILGRIHSAEDAILSIEWARQAGFENIGLDLIYGLPGQDMENWLRDLKRAVKIRPEHLSCYMLTAESGTPMDRNVKGGRVQLPKENLVRELFDTTIDYLTAHGFDHYEISNFAGTAELGAEPRRSRHNLKYWSFAPYLGLGPSAHSFIEPERFWNCRNVEKYIRQIEAGKLPIAEKEKLTKEQMVIEAVYLGLRTTRGIDLDGFEAKFGMNFARSFNQTISELEKGDMLSVIEGYCRLTRKGLPFLDSIVSMFVCQEIGV
jgi:oxygen-independent coproporphyrinogen-3 oxidase